MIERAQRGDRAALKELLTSAAPLVHRFGARMCKNDADAEDVVQDTLLAMASELSGFEGRASFSSWLFAIARSQCARKRRGLKNQPHATDDAFVSTAAAGPSPEDHASETQLRQLLDAALMGLSDEQREVLLLRDVEGLSAKEAADALAISVDALKSRLHRARSALRLALQPLLNASAPGPAAGCPDVVAALSKKLEGELGPEDCAAMEKHIESCAACGAACESLRAALGACRAVAAEEVPESIKARVKAALELLALPESR